MNLLSGFTDISFWHLIPVAAVALFASVIGGVYGYGTGARMPLVLVAACGGRAGRANHRRVGDVHKFQPRARVSQICGLAMHGDCARRCGTDVRTWRLG